MRANAPTQAKPKYRVYIDYCGTMQNFKEKCGGIFIADFLYENLRR